ncbi:S-methyl-5'-thioadenosine phosphorylase [Streptomyces sp. CA-111067]|uniref:S-methyl-5'-thioadenosine phosphorylase n=1 Tax=Streptomyces sp. CA-111067 TaxID=3240046 RepID=UPI003D96ED9C
MTNTISAATAGPRADIGVIGGTGLYSLLPDTVDVRVDTPYGPPSAPIAVAEIDGRGVAFLPRHGTGHAHPPHRINYRANLWALRSLGVRQVLAPCAVGSLRAELGPGSLVVPDQVVDRTSGREQTYFDDGAVHVSLADPYCPAGRTAVLKQAGELGLELTDGGTTVVIQGPRFSTRAESRWYARQGWSLVNMTGLPEAALARELALCYTSIALVTDVDAGVDAESAVSQEDVFEIFGRNIDRLRTLLAAVVPALPAEAERDCVCARAHDGLQLPFPLP